MKLKQTPVSYKTYYKCMQKAFTAKIEECNNEISNIKEDITKLYEKLNSRLESIKSSFDVDLNKFSEFKENTYKNGIFLRTAKGMFINRKENYELVNDLYDVYLLAKKQKDIYDATKRLALYKKLVNLSLKEYTEILRTYYIKVHEKMVLEGYGYSLGQYIGWICINRVKVNKGRKKFIDYKATKLKRQELESKGIRIYNKEEADWCSKNGIEYNAVDPRVYLDNEYLYEIPIIDSKVPNATENKLEIADYRHKSFRGLSNEDIAEANNNDKNKICKLPLDIKTKLSICTKVDKTLYTKFIRNEGQKTYAHSKANW